MSSPCSFGAPAQRKAVATYKSRVEGPLLSLHQSNGAQHAKDDREGHRWFPVAQVQGEPADHRTQRPGMIAQSPINAISMPAEAAAAVSTMATASVRKYGPWRRQLEGSGGRDARPCARCAVGSKPGGGAMGAGQQLSCHGRRHTRLGASSTRTRGSKGRGFVGGHQGATLPT